jgi:hypothetical protein
LVASIKGYEQSTAKTMALGTSFAADELRQVKQRGKTYHFETRNQNNGKTTPNPHSNSHQAWQSTGRLSVDPVAATFDRYKHKLY